MAPSQKAKPRNAVLICQVPENWRPEYPWQLPPSIVGATLYAKNLSLTNAMGFCNSHNLRQLQIDCREHVWALVVRRGHCAYDPKAFDPEATLLTTAPRGRKVWALSPLGPIEPIGPDAAGDGRCGSRVEGPESDVQSPLPFPSAPSAVDLPGLPDFGDISREMNPAAIAAAADVDELAMVLDHDIEVTPAALLVEDCR